MDISKPGGHQLMKPEGLYGHTPDFMGHQGRPPRHQMGPMPPHHPHPHSHPGFGPSESMFKQLTAVSSQSMKTSSINSAPRMPLSLGPHPSPCPTTTTSCPGHRQCPPPPTSTTRCIHPCTRATHPTWWVTPTLFRDWYFYSNYSRRIFLFLFRLKIKPFSILPWVPSRPACFSWIFYSAIYLKRSAFLHYVCK